MALFLCQLWLVAIAVMDLRLRKVRNWMVLLGLALGLVTLFSGIQPFGVNRMNGLVGMLVAFAALIPLYAMRWMGAGDVKFASVIGLLFGLSADLLFIWIGGSLLAGLHGVAVIFWRGLQASIWAEWLQARFPTPLSAAFSGLHGSIEPALQGSGKPVIQRSIPYAGYLAIAAIWVVFHFHTGSASV